MEEVLRGERLDEFNQAFGAIATDVPAPDIAGIAESIADFRIFRGGEAIAL